MVAPYAYNGRQWLGYDDEIRLLDLGLILILSFSKRLPTNFVATPLHRGYSQIEKRNRGGCVVSQCISIVNFGMVDH